jgi:hypothetical protein
MQPASKSIPTAAAAFSLSHFISSLSSGCYQYRDVMDGLEGVGNSTDHVRQGFSLTGPQTSGNTEGALVYLLLIISLMCQLYLEAT